MSKFASLVYDISAQDAAVYNCKDALATRLAMTNMTRQLRQWGLWEFYVDYVMPLAFLLRKMHDHGLLVDEVARGKFHELLTQKCMEYLTRIREAVEVEDFNPLSPPQVGKYLFERLGLRARKFSTRTGAASTDAETLLYAIIRTKHPVLLDILTYRAYSKLLSTYVADLPIWNDGRVHTELYFGTATGRLASRNPNLQNQPQFNRPKIRRLGLNLRNMYVAAPGNVLVACDSSQIELRLAAIFANCKSLLREFEEGADVHRLNAAAMYDIAPKDVTDDQRQSGKTFTYERIYMAGPPTMQKKFLLDEQVLIEQAVIKQWIHRFDEQRPELAAWAKKTHRDVLDGTPSEVVAGRYIMRNPFGRIRRMYDHPTAIYNQCLNNPMQMTVADIMGHTMLRVDARLRTGALVLQVHDELLAEVPESYGEEAALLLKEEMEKPVQIYGKLHVLPAEPKVGISWGALRKVKI